jgi:multidrug efflux pump subunit AcrB
MLMSRPANSPTGPRPRTSSPTTRSPAPTNSSRSLSATNKGAAVRLADVADVSNGAQNIRTAGYLNGIPSITIMIFRQPGANIIDTVDRVKAELPSIQASIPQGIKTTIVLDRTTTIRASVSDVEKTLILSSSW